MEIASEPPAQATAAAIRQAKKQPTSQPPSVVRWKRKLQGEALARL